MVANGALTVEGWWGSGWAHTHGELFGEERWEQAGAGTFSHHAGLCISQGLLRAQALLSAAPRAVPGKGLKPFVSQALGLLVISYPVRRLVSRGDGVWEVPSAVTFPISCSQRSLASKMTVQKPPSGLYLLLSQLFIYVN